MGQLALCLFTCVRKARTPTNASTSTAGMANGTARGDSNDSCVNTTWPLTTARAMQPTRTSDRLIRGFTVESNALRSRRYERTPTGSDDMRVPAV